MNIAGVDYESVNDGEGVRTVIYISGCSHNCPMCHNPQTHNLSYGTLFTEELQNEVFENIKKRPFIKGITLSGGDPLHENNLQDVLNLVNKIRLLLPEKTIWLYSGYTWDEIWGYNTSGTDLYGKPWRGWTIDRVYRQDILKQCDVFVDGRYIDAQRDITLSWRGSSNQRVIDVRQSLRENKIILYEI